MMNKIAWITLAVLLAVSCLSSADTTSVPGAGTTEVDRDGRFIKYANGVVEDTKTALEWIAGPDRATTWDEARSWVQSLAVDGGSWRMPTKGELKTLYKEGAGQRNMTSLLATTGWWVWSGETQGSSSAWGFYFFGSGYEFWANREDSLNYRGFAVRSRR